MPGQPLAALAAVILTLASISPLNAEVLDATPSGFATRTAVTVAAERARVYEAFVRDIGSWWNADHTFSGNADALYIDPRPLGCFCELLPNNGGLVHMMVTFVNPGVMLRLTGGLGPLGLSGVTGNMTIEFDDTDDERVMVTLDYVVGGYYPGGLDTIADAVDAVLGDQLTRLGRFVETGSPVGLPGE